MTASAAASQLLPTDASSRQCEGAEAVIGAKAAPESTIDTAAQIFFPFVLAGLGMVSAGVVLDGVAEWDVFLEIPEIFILVPALLGLKGNLEMTLASRLSTHASLGTLDTTATAVPLVLGNIALIQCQAIVVGFLASCVAVAMSFATGAGLSIDNFMLLCSSAILTGSIASFVLALIMVAVVVCSRLGGCNPDNIAAPVAASLGDLTTLSLLAWIAEAMLRGQSGWGPQAIISLYCVLVAPFCAWAASRHPHTEEVLHVGWKPILASMCISSAGGLVLDHAMEVFPRMAAFQPVMNGAGGNLVAVQASRIATHLHKQSSPGVLHEDEDSRTGTSPWSLFQGPGKHALSARVLMLLVVPGHLIFFAMTRMIAGDAGGSAGPVFLGLYLLSALVQEWILLYACLHLVHLQWSWGIDPDSAAVPYLASLGDLCGTALLTCIFLFLDFADHASKVETATAE